MRLLLIAALGLLSACAMAPVNRSTPYASSSEWHRVVTAADRDRLAKWRVAFNKALGQARKSGHGAEIDGEGALLLPDAALGNESIPNGNYLCRVIKLGAKGAGGLDYVAYPAFLCRVRQEQELQSLVKLTGSQRQVGLLFADSAIRQVFLGTLVLGTERRAFQYGQDPERDVAGWMERIGDNRWRLVMPYPRYESTIDVMELVPAP